jgi:lipopolysaccharide biosynthesis regulator YciM
VWETINSPDGKGKDVIEEVTAENLSTALSLLDELKQMSKDSQKVEILESMCGLASKQRSLIDKSIQRLQSILDKDPDNIPALFGLASAFMSEKSEV